MWCLTNPFVVYLNSLSFQFLCHIYSWFIWWSRSSNRKWNLFVLGHWGTSTPSPLSDSVKFQFRPQNGWNNHQLFIRKTHILLDNCLGHLVSIDHRLVQKHTLGCTLGGFRPLKSVQLVLIGCKSGFECLFKPAHDHLTSSSLNRCQEKSRFSWC